MRIPDSALAEYLELATGWHPDRVAEVLGELERTEGADRGRLKRLLARTVVDLYHGEGAGERAEGEFDRVYRDHAAPSDVEEYALPPQELRDGRIEVARLLALSGLVGSNREGRRKITEGGVSLDGERVTDASADVAPRDVDGRVLQLGRRRWRRIRAG
jgi:tyrosyl-tRNA synthetase